MIRNILDYITKPERPQFSIQVGSSVSNTAILLRLCDNNGSVAACITGEGDARFNKLNIANIPTSATGLASGDVWNDAGTLKIVT